MVASREQLAPTGGGGLMSALVVSTERLARTARDLLQLTKPQLSMLVLFTAAPGMWLSGEKLSLVRCLVTWLADRGVVGAANTFNCYSSGTATAS